MNPLIKLEDVTYTYPLPGGGTTPALRQVSLTIDAGEYVAIVGANGSGKSTLARHLNALLLPESGHVRIAGLDTRDPANHREIRRTVGMVFQRPEDQIVATVIEEDVAFGLENLGLPTEKIRVRVRGALEEVDLWEERLRSPHLLSAGQMQRLALAGVLALSPRCIVFDEATAMLDPLGRQHVRAMMADLHRQGITVVTITHFMEEATDAERIVVMAEGQVALDGTPAAVFSDVTTLHALGLDLPPAAALNEHLRQQIPALPGRLLTTAALAAALQEIPHYTGSPPPFQEHASAPSTAPVIAVRGLGHTYMQGTPLSHRALAGVSLSVGSGEVHGLLGATGSGKSTLLQHLNGLLRPQEGQVRVADFVLNDPKVDVKAVRRAAGLAFQMPESQIFEQYVGDEIAYGPRLAGLQGPELRERVRWAMDLVGLDFEAYKDRLTFALSGGEQRKVALASVLALRPAILLLDEPTAGLDPKAHRELLTQLQALKETGVTLLLSSHQMEDLALLAERLTILAAGKDGLAGSTRAVFAQGDQVRALGLGLPAVTEVADALRNKEWPLPAGLITAGELVNAIAGLVAHG